MSIGLQAAYEVEGDLLPVDDKGAETVWSQQGDGQIDRLGGGRRGWRGGQEFGQVQRALVGAEQVPAPVYHECRIRLMLGEHVVERAVHDRKVRRRKVPLAPNGGISGCEHQCVLLT